MSTKKENLSCVVCSIVFCGFTKTKLGWTCNDQIQIQLSTKLGIVAYVNTSNSWTHKLG